MLITYGKLQLQFDPALALTYRVAMCLEAFTCAMQSRAESISVLANES